MFDVNLDVAAATDVGHVRSHNEDSYVAGRHVWAVADGMGGQAAGERASRIAASCLRERDRQGPLDQTQIVRLIDQANDEILQYGRSHPASAGLGTTLTGIALTDVGGFAHWLVFNVGDSRVYRLTQGSLIRQTTDHCEAQILVDRGLLSPEEAMHHPRRNVLTRCVGSDRSPHPDIRLIPCAPGDRWLICSDGLTGEVEDSIVHHILLNASNSSDASSMLVRAALEHGGRDNVTVIVVGIGETSSEPDAGVIEDTLPRVEVRGS
ncbi:MAG: protein phosphatase 2C domain-containing protein [Propionibacteriaceae bacterium]|jgi:protein phosphatase|nr:protein phosphatase 2C domain-containing protein [Propionibacteriaceae bacterium]